jgi:plasmid stability protein
MLGSMATLRFRNLNQNTIRELRARAAKHGRSLAEEAVEILKTELDRLWENDPEFRRALRKDAARRRGKNRPSG